MKRRKLLQKMAQLGGGIVMLPSFHFVNKKKVQDAYQNLNISNEDHEMMGDLCEFIIPSDKNYKGAKDLGVQVFVLLMVNDCLTKEHQNNFLMGWKEFKNYSQKNGIIPSIATNKDTWPDSVVEILSGKTANGNKESNLTDVNLEKLDYFLNTVKQFSILGYTHSEYYMTSIMSYKMVPGIFKGSIPFREFEKVNLYG